MIEINDAVIYSIFAIPEWAQYGLKEKQVAHYINSEDQFEREKDSQSATFKSKNKIRLFGYDWHMKYALLPTDAGIVLTTIHYDRDSGPIQNLSFVFARPIK